MLQYNYAIAKIKLNCSPKLDANYFCISRSTVLMNNLFFKFRDASLTCVTKYYAVEKNLIPKRLLSLI